MSEPFIGEIRALPYFFAPYRWARCDGQLMDIGQNAALFSILGVTYGGDGRTSFGIPGLGQRTPMHQGTGPGLTPRRWGEVEGRSTLPLSCDQMPSHTHTANAAARETPDTDTPEGNNLTHRLVLQVGGQDDSKRVYTEDDTTLVAMASDAVSTVGHSQDHENRQPFLAVNFCIALDGIYPSRS